MGRFLSPKRVVIIILSVCCVVLIGISAYLYLQNRKIIANPQAAVEQENEAMLKRIGAVMDLPREKPTIITVVDREKLQDQEFFQKAQNGDKIIVYEAARRIILYRPGTGKVIDVVPLAYNTPTPPQTPPAQVESMGQEFTLPVETPVNVPPQLPQ